MNILITSAGRRVGLLEAFKAVAHQRGGKLFAADIDGLAPALYNADQAVRLPAIRHPNYGSCLQELVERYRIQLVVPTIDPELPILAGESQTLARVGCQVLVSNEVLIRTTEDKWQTVTTFRERSLRVPDSWLPEQLDGVDLPDHLFVKPRSGSASQHTYRVRRQDLTQVLPRVPDPIIQPELQGPEITIDALLDLSGQPIHYVPRRRIRTLGGESIQGVTVPDDNLRDWILAVLETTASLGGRGPITVQAFLTPEGPTLTEINPRFGGGFPLALAAGGEYPEWIGLMVEGKTVAPRIGRYRHGLYMTRYHAEVITERPLWQ